jgi:hypothetical protein
MSKPGGDITSLRPGRDPRVVPPCCAVMRNDGALRQVLLLAGLEQLLLSPEKAEALAMDLRLAAELARSGPAKDLLPPIGHHPV